MKCQFCDCNEATMFIEETNSSKKVNINICLDCAIKHNIIENYLNLNSKIKSKTASPIYKKINRDIEKLECFACGYQLADYLDTMSLSCPNCYNEFKNVIKKSVRNIHNKTKHETEATDNYLKAIKKEKKIKKLELKLNNLVQEEQYEEAAFVRDTIEKEKKYILEKFGV